MDVVYGHVSGLPANTLKQARWKSMSGLELSGFIDVKMPTKERKFSSWKAWKRQWCVISRCGNAVTMQIGSDKCNLSTTIHVPEESVLCRTESRSKTYAFGLYSPIIKHHKETFVFMSGESETETQKWMSNIRALLKEPASPPEEDYFEISLIDNEHSRKAGLQGLYGRLMVTPVEIAVRDTHTNKCKVTWHWSQISHSYLPLPNHPEDVHRICTICTSGKFKSGEGELQVFCLKADVLHEKLSTCPRYPNVPRIVTSPLPPTPPSSSPPGTPLRSRVRTSPGTLSAAYALENSRRMSRSENDLQRFFLQRPLAHMGPAGSQELILLSNEDLTYVKKMPNLLFANVGFLISTPGCSEPESLHDFLSMEGKSSSSSPPRFARSINAIDEVLDEGDDSSMKDDAGSFRSSIGSFRSSNSSYKGAASQSSKNSKSDSDIYEEITPSDFGASEEEFADTPPPPLPPRQSQRKHIGIQAHIRLHPKPPKFEITDMEYVPMAPGTSDQKYLIMTNAKDKVTISKPVPI